MTANEPAQPAARSRRFVQCDVFSPVPIGGQTHILIEGSVTL